MEISCPCAKLLCVNHLPFTYKVAGFDKSYSSEIMLDYFEVPKDWYELWSKIMCRYHDTNYGTFSKLSVKATLSYQAIFGF